MNCIRMFIRASLFALVAIATIPVAAQPSESGDQARVIELVRHELAMMPNITVFDYLSFKVERSKITLSGYTVRPTNKSEAERRVKGLEAVEEVDNQIEVLPLGSMDRQIRAGVRARLQRMLPRYFSDPAHPIRIIVKRGNVELFGTVDREMDKNIAGVQANSVHGVFQVTNNLILSQ